MKEIKQTQFDLIDYIIAYEEGSEEHTELAPEYIRGVKERQFSRR